MKRTPIEEWSREKLLKAFQRLQKRHRKFLKDKRDEDKERIAMYQEQIQDRRRGY